MIENWKQYKDLKYYPDRVCACGCGGKIKVYPHHKYTGIPRYILYHYIPNELATKSNKGRPAWNRLPRELRFCKNCDTSFEVSIHSTQKYCTVKCGRKCQKRNKHCEETKQKIRSSLIAYWKTIGISGGYSREFNAELRIFVRERDGNTCQLCGKTKKEEGRNLCVHHIDYNKQNSNSRNLVALCTRCHVKVNYNRASWGFIFLWDKLWEDQIIDEEAILAFSGIFEEYKSGSNLVGV